jgi:hypothetical protein
MIVLNIALIANEIGIGDRSFHRMNLPFVLICGAENPHFCRLYVTLRNFPCALQREWADLLRIRSRTAQ